MVNVPSDFNVDTELCLLLSCQRSVEALNKMLVSVVSELVHQLPFYIYINSGTNFTHSFYLLNTVLDDIENEKILSRINQLDFSKWENGFEESRRLHFYPAIADDQIFACVVMEGEVTENTERHLHSFLGIYSNIQVLINDSTIDGLTHLYNRKQFNKELEFELSRTLRGERRRLELPIDHSSSYLAIIDIDHFKRVNDQYGHLIGDEVIIKLASIIRSSFRDRDGLYRYGGEEFAVILRDIEFNDIEGVLTRFCDNVRKTIFPTVTNITVSIGFCLLNDEVSPVEAISHADKALYYSKDHGRDQISNYQWLVANNQVSATLYEDDIELF